MLDYGRLVLFIGVCIYFAYKFFKTRKLGDLILMLFGVFGVISGSFLVGTNNQYLLNENLYNIFNGILLIILFILLSFYFSKNK